MPKPFSVALVMGGIMLLVLAEYAGDSASSGFSRLLQGTPDNQTIILLALGVVAVGAGFFGVVRSLRS